MECYTINITTKNFNRTQCIGLAFTGTLRIAFVTGTVLLNLWGLPQLSPAILMWWNQSRMLRTDELPWLHQIPKDSAKWASVVRSSVLYDVPSPRLNAFAVGNHREGGIAVTNEMLRTLSCREIRAFLVHKMTHFSTMKFLSCRYQVLLESWFTGWLGWELPWFYSVYFLLAVLTDSSIAMVVAADGGSMTLSTTPSRTLTHQEFQADFGGWSACRITLKR